MTVNVPLMFLHVHSGTENLAGSELGKRGLESSGTDRATCVTFIRRINSDELRCEQVGSGVVGIPIAGAGAVDAHSPRRVYL
jgi:hypothetical protein